MNKLIIPKWGSPREAIKQFPKGSYAIAVETTYFVNNKWIEKRKIPLYHVVRISGFIDMEGTFGHSGLLYRKVRTFRGNLQKAIEKAEGLNDHGHTRGG